MQGYTTREIKWKLSSRSINESLHCGKKEKANHQGEKAEERTVIGGCSHKDADKDKNNRRLVRRSNRTCVKPRGQTNAK